MNSKEKVFKGQMVKDQRLKSLIEVVEPNVSKERN